jgi:hypothetical protein
MDPVETFGASILMFAAFFEIHSFAKRTPENWSGTEPVVGGAALVRTINPQTRTVRRPSPIGVIFDRMSTALGPAMSYTEQIIPA